jgi:3-dehydroquinate dehydratase/shikimate dehydrogenase
MSQLIGVVKGPSIRAAKEEIAKAKDLAHLLEIRLDLFEPKALTSLNELPHSLPFLFTFRKKSQGGARDLPEHERQELFLRCLKKCEPAYCDIEADTELAFIETVHREFPKMRIIGSFHDFTGIPPHLDQLLERMQKPQFSHYKMAFKAHSTNETLQIMSFLKEKKHLTCIAMGPEGALSRILAPVLGSEFCYAAIEDGDAPYGQIGLRELCQTYRFKELTPHTKIYALLGFPVDKSVGHLFHNKSFPKNAVYVKLPLESPELPLFFSLMRQFPFGGFSVTMPLKEQLGRFLTRVDPAAAAIGSVNTIDVDGSHLIGYNTDGLGAMTALERHKKPIKGLRVMILGAGGSGRAIAYAALEKKTHVTVLNRSVARAEALAKDFHCEGGPMENIATTPYDVLINTIPEDLLFDPSLLKEGTIIMDIVYWEKETPLLKVAREQHCTTISGIEMFEEQARLQQEIWFKK